MLKIKNLTKNYKKHEVLRGLNMLAEDGEVYALLGKNGAGKTTTMNIAADLLAKNGGTIEMTGGDARGKSKLGYLPENPSLFGYMTGSEYLSYIASCGNIPAEEAKTLIPHTLSIVGLTSEAAKRRVRGYSRGMTQRLGIAAAILNKPDLLILDEPTSALDPQGRAEVMEIIGRLKRSGTTIILCTHILTDAERVADKVGIISGGVMSLECPMSDLAKKSSGAVGVRVRFVEAEPKHYAALRELDGVTASEIDPRTGELTLSGENSQDLCMAVISTLTRLNACPEIVSLIKPNLETIYLDTVK